MFKPHKYDWLVALAAALAIVGGAFFGAWQAAHWAIGLMFGACAIAAYLWREFEEAVFGEPLPDPGFWWEVAAVGMYVLFGWLLVILNLAITLVPPHGGKPSRRWPLLAGLATIGASTALSIWVALAVAVPYAEAYGAGLWLACGVAALLLLWFRRQPDDPTSSFWFDLFRGLLGGLSLGAVFDDRLARRMGLR